jgi:hypothetical protein
MMIVGKAQASTNSRTLIEKYRNGPPGLCRLLAPVKDERIAQGLALGFLEIPRIRLRWTTVAGARRPHGPPHLLPPADAPYVSVSSAPFSTPIRRGCPSISGASIRSKDPKPASEPRRLRLSGVKPQ